MYCYPIIFLWKNLTKSLPSENYNLISLPSKMLIQRCHESLCLCHPLTPPFSNLAPVLTPYPFLYRVLMFPGRISRKNLVSLWAGYSVSKVRVRNRKKFLTHNPLLRRLFTGLQHNFSHFPGFRVGKKVSYTIHRWQRVKSRIALKCF